MTVVPIARQQTPKSFDERLLELNDRLAFGFVLLVMSAALALSFSALQQQATHYGFTGWKSIVWPLFIDGVIVAQSLALIRRQKLGLETRYTWFLLLVHEAASIGLNAVMGADILGYIVHALPPLSLLMISKAFANDVKDSHQSERWAEVERLRSDKVALEAALAELRETLLVDTAQPEEVERLPTEEPTTEDSAAPTGITAPITEPKTPRVRSSLIKPL